MAPRAEQLARPPPARRARLPVLGGVGAARPRLRVPPHDRASPADPPRAPDAHAARGPGELAKLARRLGYAGEAETVAHALLRVRPDASHRARRLRGVLRRHRAGGPGGAAVGRGERGVGFADPERARQNLRLLWEGPALVAVPVAVRTAAQSLIPATLDALRTVPDPDAALDALERFVAAAGPRTAYLARLAATPDLLGGVLTFFTRSSGSPSADRAAGAARRAGPTVPAAPRAAPALRAAFRTSPRRPGWTRRTGSACGSSGRSSRSPGAT